MGTRNSPLHQFANALEGIAMTSDASDLERLSLDYYWYSPVLFEQLQHKRGELVVFPETEQAVMQIAAAAAKYRVKLTIRGGGTGNYGQCIPLEGGVIVDVKRLNKVIALEPGWMRVEAGILIDDADQSARQQQQELLMWPSTKRTATLGGFIAGGYAGVGSIRHGILKDPGNVRMIRVVTVEITPRIIELRGADIQKVHHAFGTNGIITQVEVALTPAQPWLHHISLFEGYDKVLNFGVAASRPDMDLKLLTSVDQRFAQFFDEIPQYFPATHDAMFAIVNESALKDYEALAARFGGVRSLCDSEENLDAKGLPPAYECAYNHTTLRALAKDRSYTYLQIAYPQPFDATLVLTQMQRWGEEMYQHHEFAKQYGGYVLFGLPLLNYFDKPRLYEIMAEFEADGCTVFDPHVYTIEDGGMKQIDHAQIDFKRIADPMGLMNPGKTRA